jgi:Fe-S oxidoreductase
MCPTFRVTRDETHVTRGRANTLRLAISGQLGARGLEAPAVAKALELCVGCKGCRRECPTGIDMARMKSEALYQTNKVTGIPWSRRLVTELPRYAPYVARVFELTRLVDKLPGARGLLQRWFGISAERSLPRWQKDFFGRQDELDASRARLADRRPSSDADRGTVALLVDTFSRWFEPENARAALDVLHLAGYDVVLPEGDSQSRRPLCCGRTYLAEGDIDSARREMMRTTRSLVPLAEKGVPILGLEPACIFSFDDEFRAVIGDEVTDTLARHTHQLESFLLAEHREGRLSLELASLGARRASVHGHCHQKAFAEINPTLDLLRLIPDLDVELIESSCCGMAGSFGYSAKHFDVSMKMAEANLLPSVRALPEDALLIANGTSCRHQIADGAGRGAQHAVHVLLASAMVTGQH